jgi:hypothetical protein
MSDREDTAQARPDTSDVRVHDPNWRTFQKYRMKKFPGRKVTLPTGINLEASRWANVRPPGTDDTFVLHSPEKILKNPNPACRYIWRIRNNDDTIGLVETNEIRPVAMEELVRDRRTAKIIGWVGPNGLRFAGWKRHGLFEVSPQSSYEWFGYPEDEAIAKLQRLGPTFEHQVEEEMQGKMVGNMTISDTKKASQERRGR